MLQTEERFSSSLCTSSYWHIKANELFLAVLNTTEKEKKENKIFNTNRSLKIKAILEGEFIQPRENSCR